MSSKYLELRKFDQALKLVVFNFKDFRLVDP
jgi:hypothetical protein